MKKLNIVQMENIKGSGYNCYWGVIPLAFATILTGSGIIATLTGFKMYQCWS